MKTKLKFSIDTESGKAEWTRTGKRVALPYERIIDEENTISSATRTRMLEIVPDRWSISKKSVTDGPVTLHLCIPFYWQLRDFIATPYEGDTRESLWKCPTIEIAEGPEDALLNRWCDDYAVCMEQAKAELVEARKLLVKKHLFSWFSLRQR